jgi:hypothetical protein
VLGVLFEGAVGLPPSKSLNGLAQPDIIVTHAGITSDRRIRDTFMLALIGSAASAD